MDRPLPGSHLSRAASERVVEVYSGHDGLAGVTGSGYVVAPGLVLTSGHLADPAVPCLVRGAGVWTAAEPVWRGRGPVTAALLRVPEPDGSAPEVVDRLSPGSLGVVNRGAAPWVEPRGRVRWGRVAGDGVRCVVAGAGAGGSAVVDAGTGPAYLNVEMAGTGRAGAVLLAEPTGHLVGVVGSPSGDVVPVEGLLLDEAFRARVGEAELEDVAGDERVVLLPELLEPAVAEPPEGCPDWSLPAARHAVVPFVGRKAELGALRDWAAGPEPLSAALITGPGGSGKSRLAVELCAELAAAGWDAGLLPEPSLVAPLADPAVRFDAMRPTLLVLDFPEPSAALAAELVRRLASHRHNPPVRLLLVARASAGPAPPSAAWWRRLDTAAGGRVKRLVRAVVRLEDHPLTLPERAEHAAAAIRAFSPDGLARIRPFPLDDPLYAVPLRVHVAALMRVRGHEVGPGNELIGRFLSRVRERWPEARDDAVAVAVLAAPSPKELRVLLSVLPDLAEERRAEVAAWVAGLFSTDDPGPQGTRREEHHPESEPHRPTSGSEGEPHPCASGARNEPHPGGRSGAGWEGRLVMDVPDLVAGQLLAETAELESLVIAIHDHPGRTAAHLARMLDVLRVGADHDQVRAALRALVVQRLDRMLVEAAMGPGEQLGDRLNAVLRLLRDEPEVAEAVAALPPWEAGHPGVRALKVTLAEMLVERLRGGKRADLATALSASSAWLAAAGRLPEAVAAAGEAAELFAAAPPYEQAQGHAEALYNQAACLLLSGVPELAVRPAREAVARFRILAEEDPRYGAHGERAQYNLACALAGAGRLREAVKAFLAAGGDGQVAGDMDAVLSVLPGPGEDEGAPQETGAYVDGGASSPYGTGGERSDGGDPAAPHGGAPPYARGRGAGLLPGGSPGGGGALGPLDELDEERLLELGAWLAAGAAGTVRGVAVTDQEVCRRLYGLGLWLERQGQGDAAVVVAGEAVGRLRGIAAEEPGLRAVLAAAAGLVSRVHGERGELEAAVRGAEEAVDNLRALVVLEPGRYREELAGRLRDLGEHLLLSQRSEGALDVLLEAVRVADGLGGGHERLVAGCRGLLGVCLVELGRLVDGLAQFEAAAGLLQGAGEDDERLRRDVAGWIRRLRVLLGQAISSGETSGAAHAGQPRQHAGAGERVARVRAGLASAEAGMVAGRHEAAGDLAPHEVSGAWVLDGLSLAGMVARSGESADRAEEALAALVARRESDVAALVGAQVRLAWVWAGAGRARDAVVLAARAADLLLQQTVQIGEDPTHPRATDQLWGAVEAALGKALLGLGRAGQAVPHLLAGAGVDEGERLLLAACALSGLGRWEEAEEVAEQAAGVAREATPLAVALRLAGGTRFARGDYEGALEAAEKAVEALPEAATVAGRLLTGTCLQLRGLCRMRAGQDEAAGLDLVRGTTLIAGLLDNHGPLAPEPAATHLLALLALGEAQRDPVPFLGRALEIRPLPPAYALRTLLDELGEHLDGRAELLGPLTGFAEAFTREVPVSACPGLHRSLGDCLERYAALTGEAAAAEAAVRVFQGLAVDEAGCRERLGVALAALGGIEHELARAVPATLERAADLLAGSAERAVLARTLALYGDTLLGARRPVEALAQLERAADLCDELDEPAVAALAYANLGAALAALDRPQAALEAVAWSVAEQERTPEGGPAARAKADEVRGMVLRRMGRTREALAHLVEAVNQYRALPRTAARRLAEAEAAVVIVDDLLADGRAGEAVEYAALAVEGYAACASARLKQALAKQRLVRCHLMCGALGEAAPLVEELIVDARREPDDLTYRAVLADSLAQSAELLTMLHLDDGPKAEAQAREAIRLYDELIAAGVAAEGVHAGRAGANLSLAAALASQERYEDEVAPLREAVAALERQATGNPLLGGHLARAMLMLGDALMAAGRAPEASAVLHRSTRMIADGYLSAVAHYQLGLCELRLGRGEAADAALRSADGRLRELLAHEDDEELVEMHRDVLRARLELHERAGRPDEVALVERDLITLRWFRAG